ncbi:MAG: gamma-glutamylcyclotransferase [Rhodospirillaceae bacterium]|nr:gamma-glutamylcyclotransferase [Rhodospirillaceae bacterium]
MSASVSLPPIPDVPPPPSPSFLALAERRPLWVFGYGSLMWDPGFASEESASGRLHGYHRRFCIYSHHYRGTPERPGLVLGLDRGGSCRGMAYRVAPETALEVLGYLWHREMITAVYRPRIGRVHLVDGRMVEALTFVADPRHPQYHAGRCVDAAAAMIRAGRGKRGPNRDYLLNTLAHLETLGIHDDGLRRVLAALDGPPQPADAASDQAQRE